jgi:glycosyltransferase involved in cell wall biosynthesis
VIGDGPARAAVEDALAPAGPGRVTFGDRMDETDLPAILTGCDICLWPAIKEAYGMALLEAQAAGLPVVAGETPGVAAIVADGETGLLTPAGDVDAFANAAARLLYDPVERARMGQTARAKVAREHDIDAAAAALDAVLRRLRGGRAA